MDPYYLGNRVMPMEGRGPHDKEPAGGKDTVIQWPETSLTKLRRVAIRAKEDRNLRFTSLGNLLDKVMLRESWRRIRKDGAAGVDGITAKEYGLRLEDNLRNLYQRQRLNQYQAPPVRRVWIPKVNGTLRPIGVPATEDKILQRAVASIMEVIFDPNFLDCSYGFRPGRNAHQAVEAIQKTLTFKPITWVLELDIESFYDNLNHEWLRKMVNLRLGDGHLRRLIGKWLEAGVMQEAQLLKQDKGSPQGGIVSPTLANIYLHCVLDVWFERKVKPTLKGQAYLWRYADDGLLAFEYEEDARKVLELLKLRIGKFSLKLNETKTRLLNFKKPEDGDGRGNPDGKPPTFDFLGFTHYWGISRKGRAIVKRKTAASRIRRAMSRMAEWCRRNRHESLKRQQAHLNAALRGHYNYYGITGNWNSLQGFFLHVVKVWKKWLGRRSQKGYIRWERMRGTLERYALEAPRVVHSIYRAPPRVCESLL